MSLATYRAKRDFRLTREPRGRARGRRGTLVFIVQKHSARSLHYDFRLEHGGVLWSWAVPKGPSLDPGIRRLAVEVEDHPIEYGDFEGEIPNGQYGAGTVEIWDRGTWTPEGDPAAGHRDGKLHFSLDGGKLSGRFALVRTRANPANKPGKATWLLIKRNDGRVQRAGDEPAGRKARMPAMMSPMLATLVARAPEGDDWIHEIKYDGYRMLARVDRGRARLLSRNGRDWTRHFPGVVRDLAALEVDRAWLDGEIVVVEAEGRTNFQALQNALTGDGSREIAYFAFDLPYLDGVDLRDVPLVERKRLLRGVVGAGIGDIRVGPEVRGGGAEFHRQACALRLEGLVAKRADSPYAAGRRSRDWVKVKCTRRQAMVIGGYTEPQGSRPGFGALLLGTYDRGELRYAGKVGTGFGDRALRDICRQLVRREQAKPPFVDPPPGHDARGAHWVRPDLVAEVSFTEWSAGGALRHPSFVGLRLDKEAIDVTRQKPAATPVPRRRTRAAAGDAAGVGLSHPDKVYFPEAGITKRELAQYYVEVASRLVPHVADRPLSLVRCPDGWQGQCFYQKHANRSVHAAVARVAVPESGGAANYFAANSAAALAGLVQWGVIELHPWAARTRNLDRPDRLIFDLDPDEKLRWPDVVAAVNLLRTLLEELGLRGYPKTTGGKGLHVVLPVRPTLTWEDAKAFTRAVADFLARTFPDRFIATAAKNRRDGRIFIDYLRNARGATAVAPYAVRARRNAPVATPVAWPELIDDVRFDHFNLRNVRERLARQRHDPWADFFTTRQTITVAIRRRFG